MKKFKVKRDVYCEHYLHEAFNYPRPSLEVKKLIKGDIVELDKEWSNLYGTYYRVLKGINYYDISSKDLEEVF